MDMGWGKYDSESAVFYLKVAKDLYQKWGALAVVQRFDKEFGDYIAEHAIN
jgi:hypothetical protein